MSAKDPKREPSYDELLLPAALRDVGDVSPWIDAKPFPVSTRTFSFVSGNRESQAIRVRYFEKKAARQFAGRAWFGPETEGPPGHAHGGSQAALLDEGMGAAAWLSGQTVLAAKIEINFRAPLPLGTILNVRAEITKIEGKKVFTSGRLETDDGTVFSDGTGLFVVIDTAALMRKVNAAKGRA
jgi:acyl-coenzyme A thioesterase PaaI-like protein